ncbi:probable 28S ribosomal protein S25, mitochondrial [Trichonephila inaurata madagascariensis]|uniref:Small ribosomal subunit protein mS25 n=1 Tax=Trichonephila inaurata madagascariensis TaxID=2747483 RepID=A0A8X6ITX8_9ARAC|nr:probable 28S ribosomal protein S25, mitochondrial [Trichonephila inaurata madagascariensis]
MPFQLGKDAIRRTIPYLKQGRLILRENVKVMTINYNDTGDYHKGTRDFVYWNMCQIQYKNPNVQIVFYKNKFPTPFIRCWLDSGEDVLIDVFNKSSEEIMNHLVKTLGLPDIKEETEKQEYLENICKFGSKFERHCMCEIPGQIPCPQIVPFPKHMTGKYKLENSLWPPKGQERY